MSLKTLDIPIQSSTLKPVIVQGDTIPKVTITSTDFPDLTTSTIKMQLYSSNRVKLLDLSVGSGLTVLSATSFEIDAISAANNTLPVGTHTGDLQIEDASGVRVTYFRVRYTIQKQYTV